MTGRVASLSLAVTAASATNLYSSNEQAASGLNKVITLLSSILAENKKAKHNEEVAMARTQAWYDGYVVEANGNVGNLNQGIDNADAANEEATANAGAAAETIETAQGEQTKAQSLLSTEKKEDKEDKELCAVEIADMDETLDALGRALTVMQSSQGRSKASLIQALPEVARPAITAFLQQKEDPTQQSSYSYESQSGNIVQMIEDFQSEFETKRTDRSTECQNLRNNHQLEIQDLTLEIENLKAKISNEKTIKANAEARAGKEKGKASALRAELKTAEDGLQQVKDEHAQKVATYTSNQKIRTDEIAALATGVGILNKAVGAFLQKSSQTALKVATALVQTQSLQLRAPGSDRVLGMLMKASKISQSVSTDLELVTQAVRSGGAMDQVTTMIRELIEKLIDQGRNEATHEGWCVNQQGSMDKKLKHATAGLDRDQTALKRAENDMAQSGRKIKDLTKSLAQEEGAYNEKTSIRMDEKTEFEQFSKDKEVFIKALEDASNVISEMMDAQPQVMLQAEDAVLTQMMTEQPAEFDAYSGSQKTGNVVDILNTITTDEKVAFDRSKTDESTAADKYTKYQTNYLAQKSQNEVNLQNQQQINSSSKKMSLEQKEAIANDQKILKNYGEEKENLNKACVPKVTSHEERAAQRQQEIDTLKTVQEVLENA